MERLFVYGTLRFPKHQREAWARTCKTTLAQVEGFQRSYVMVEGDKYIVAWPSKQHSIRGAVLELTKKELEKSDRYEDRYVRRKVRLSNGESVWMYQYKYKRK